MAYSIFFFTVEVNQTNYFDFLFPVFSGEDVLIKATLPSILADLHLLPNCTLVIYFWSLVLHSITKTIYLKLSFEGESWELYRSIIKTVTSIQPRQDG